MSTIVIEARKQIRDTDWLHVFALLTFRNKMHELLRQNAIDNHKALKDARGAMTGEINARIDQISREQFKEVQIYIDKIKERVSVLNVLIVLYIVYCIVYIVYCILCWYGCIIVTKLAFSPLLSKSMLKNMDEITSITTGLI